MSFIRTWWKFGLDEDRRCFRGQRIELPSALVLSAITVATLTLGRLIAVEVCDESIDVNGEERTIFLPLRDVNIIVA